MIDDIIAAAHNFAQHQLDSSCMLVDDIPEVRTLIAYIDITDQNGALYRVYVACDETLMRIIAFLFLGEEESDEVTLRDVALEVANMVIGSAKVISEERGTNPFSIGTPHFVAHERFDLAYDALAALRIKTESMLIALKELS